ncbi:hypothetical protein BDB01DRAFT_850610 [Pilobolus umbonatus]|nr:hypothetical protein BDB01DRAFT_850610 [Pilobolus umbonatus]
MSLSKQTVVSAYRRLIRTQREVFATDQRAYLAAKKESYNQFMKFKDETDAAVIEEKLRVAKDVEAILKKNVIQAVKKEDNTFKLRITKDTELGDNDSIKNTKNIGRKRREKHTHQCCGGH